MDFIIEAAVDVVGEVISEGIDAAIASKKKRKKIQEEEADVNQELNH